VQAPALQDGAKEGTNRFMSQGGKQDRRQAREQRLSAALRENLRRRKAQARGRGEAEAVEAAPPQENGQNDEPQAE
jgi:hypothetical protein